MAEALPVALAASQAVAMVGRVDSQAGEAEAEVLPPRHSAVAELVVLVAEEEVPQPALSQLAAVDLVGAKETQSALPALGLVAPAWGAPFSTTTVRWV